MTEFENPRPNPRLSITSAPRDTTWNFFMKINTQLSSLRTELPSGNVYKDLSRDQAFQSTPVWVSLVHEHELRRWSLPYITPPIAAESIPTFFIRGLQIERQCLEFILSVLQLYPWRIITLGPGIPKSHWVTRFVSVGQLTFYSHRISAARQSALNLSRL